MKRYRWCVVMLCLALTPACGEPDDEEVTGGEGELRLDPPDNDLPESEQPCGSYRLTCVGGHLSDEFGESFCATCRTSHGSYVGQSCIRKAQCPDWNLTNVNGTLTCTPMAPSKRVTNYSDLTRALVAAPACSKVEITAGAVIDVPSNAQLLVKDRVILSGPPSGALPLLRGAKRDAAKGALASLVRVGAQTHLRRLIIDGPDGSLSAHRDTEASAVFAFRSPGVEISQCELRNWPYAGVSLQSANHAFIHHNKIHHTRMEGLGYGVVLFDPDRSSTLYTALIESNLFNANRHAISSTGQPNLSYMARDNLIGRDRQRDGQAFDVHGVYETTGPTTSPWAGRHTVIQGNTVLAPSVANPPIMIRGIPAANAATLDNCFVGQGAPDGLNVVGLGGVTGASSAGATVVSLRPKYAGSWSKYQSTLPSYFRRAGNRATIGGGCHAASWSPF